MNYIIIIAVLIASPIYIILNNELSSNAMAMSGFLIVCGFFFLYLNKNRHENKIKELISKIF